MGLLDALFGTQAQAPGATQQPSGLQQLFQPEVAMPIAAALLGGQGDAKNFGNAFAAYGQTKAQTAQKNKTMDYFRQNAPEYAAMVDAGLPLDEAWKTYTQRKYAQTGNRYINAGSGSLFDTQTNQWISAPGGGSDSVAGLQPVWLRDPKTNRPVLGQLRKDGTIVRSAMPDGLEPVAPYDLNFDKASGTAAGKGAGEAFAALPGASQLSQTIDKTITDIKNDPYLPNMVGPVYGRLPNMTSDAERVQQKIDQLKGGAFLQARQALKGGGAITDYEGRKAEEAYTRLSQAQSLDDFNKALDDFNYFVQQGLAKLQAQASQRPLYQGGGVGQPGPQAPAGANTTSTGIQWSVSP